MMKLVVVLVYFCVSLSNTEEIQQDSEKTATVSTIINELNDTKDNLVESVRSTEGTAAGNTTLNEVNRQSIETETDTIPVLTTRRPPGAYMNFSTDREEYTLAERNALAKFRPMVNHLLVNDDNKTDANLMRWLRVRDLDVQKSFELLEEIQKWRKVNKVDGILNETILELHPSPYIIDGYDREGYPIVQLRLGGIDFRKLIVRGWEEKLFRFGIQTIEKLTQKPREASKIFGKEISQVVVLADLQGYNLRQHFCLACIPSVLNMYILLDKYYPGIMKYAIAINVPRVALPVVELVRPLGFQKFFDILHFFPPDRKEWSAYINKYISPDQLPIRFGGTKRN